jgi:hypothetical protein
MYATVARTELSRLTELSDDDRLDCIGVHYTEVDLAARRTAEMVRSIAVRTLWLSQSTVVHWYRPVTGAEWPRFQTPRLTRGFVERHDTYINTAWIKVAPATPQLARTVAHECRHLYQHCSGRWPTTEAERVAGEIDAERWAEEVADLIFFDRFTGMPISYT